MIHLGDYLIAEPETLPTPAMLLFEDLVDHNIRGACELAQGGENLFTHVKTHKSEAMVRKQIAMGIDSFKCSTLNELEMTLLAGARRAILAFPQTQACKIERLLEVVASHPDAWIATIAGAHRHIELLGGAAAGRRQRLRVMLDLDTGMHRTGVGMDRDALELYRELDRHAFLEAAGLHMYDGQDVCRGARQREQAAQRHIDSLRRFRLQLESMGLAVPFVVAGGAYSFEYYARTEGMHGSPGSFIYWDARCRGHMPEMPFRCAALILTQVVDRHPERNTVTTDLGYKSICSDQTIGERAVLPGHETAELVMHSEEYGVFRMPRDLPCIGDYLLAIPWHVGPTTVRYPGAHVIDHAGRVVDFVQHSARDRS